LENLSVGNECLVTNHAWGVEFLIKVGRHNVAKTTILQLLKQLLGNYLVKFLLFLA